MILQAIKTNLAEIIPFRKLFLQENNFQIRYNAQHERGWSDSYLISLDNENIGYGSVSGKENIPDRDAIFEFYIIPSYRKIAPPALLELSRISGASFIICQSNDALLQSLLFQFDKNIQADTVLLREDFTSSIFLENIVFRKRCESDTIFAHHAEPIGDFVLEIKDEIVATGGFLLHYNMPFADLYMEVREDCRRKGFGSFLIQN